MTSTTGAAEQPAGTVDDPPRIEDEPATGEGTPPAPARGRAALGYLVLAFLAYVPVLRSDPGKVAADTKQYLYLDPARLLERAAYMWDPHIGMGTVTHQNIGYLFPMGPYFWLFDKLGFPDWFAQRIWLGSILFFAGAGVLYLLRTFGFRGPGVVVGALAYMFTPYTLNYSARISVLLLPFAALPWLIGLTRKAVRDGGWRYPALFALVVQLVGGVNATALIFAGVGPVLWLLYAWLVDREGWRRVLSATARIAVLTLFTSLWWMAGLEMQGTYGLDILRYTETVRAVASTSFPNEILRGLGYWFFYGGDRLDPWIESASHYTQRPAVLFAGYGLVIVSLLAAGVLRWRHRLFFVALLLVGMIIAVGPSPYADPTPLGSVFKAFATSSSAGLALRSTARAVPLVVLALAVLLGLAVNVAYRSLRERGQTWLAGAVVGFVVLLIAVNLPALFDGSWYGENLERPENVPAYWTEATQALDRDSHSTRVLEEPGADFAAYSWGSTVDPITPGLMDRPYVARELIPYGTAGTADLLNAFDRRLQEGVAEPEGFADVLRRMGIGAVVLRNDIQYQRYDLVRPHDLDRVFASIPGLGAPKTYGPPSPLSTGKPTPPGSRAEDEISLGSPPNQPLLHPLVVYPVQDPRPIVRAESARRSVMLAGDGEGLVDAANAGLLAGSGVVRYSASYPTASELREAIAPDATLVLTDQNRARARIWGAVHENVGYTEQAGEKPLVDDPNNNQLPLFPGESTGAMTTTQQRGIKSIQASAYGNTITYTPEDRAVRALDGDVETAWRAAALGKAVGQVIRLQLDEPITTDHVNLVQPVNGGRNRWITKVDVTFDGDDTQTYALDASSRSPSGQTLTFPTRRFSTMQLRVAAVNDPRKYVFGGADGVGFAEIRLRDRHADRDVRADEVVQMPRDLLAAVEDTDRHPLVILMSRQALRPVPPRTDPERAIVRTFELPAARTFALTGTASVSLDASDVAIDGGLGVRSPVTAEASESLLGCIECRASAAADGDPSTAWTTPFVGVNGQWVQFDNPDPITFDRMRLQFVADGRHSVPTQIELAVDGSVRQLTLPPIRDRASENATVTVPLRFPAISGRRIRVTITGVRTQLATRMSAGDTVSAPVGIAELGIAGLRTGRAPASVAGACRSDLLTIDGQPFPVRVSGPSAEAASFSGLDVTPCDPADPGRVPVVRLQAGTHDVRTAQGVDRGVQLDRVVLASAAGDGPLAVREGRVTGLGATSPPGPEVTVTRDGDTRMRVHVSGADEPFWLVLGQSQSAGWKATVAGGDSLGASQLVDGYANGWLVPHPAREFDVVLEWTPQGRVWTAIWISIAAVLACIAIACGGFVRARRRARGDTLDPRDADARLEWPVPPRGSAEPGRGRVRVVVPLLAGLVAALVFAPWAGALVALLLLGMQWRPRLRVVFVLGPSLLLALAAAYILYLQRHFQFPALFEWPTLFPYARPLGWLAVVFLAADVVAERFGGRREPSLE